MSYEKIEHADNPVVEGNPGPESGPSERDREVAEVEAERARRLDPANRPDGAEVDNTHATLPTLESWREAQAEDPDAGANAGSSDPSRAFAEREVPEEERAEIEAERARRLDPANRPEGAEVDNTGRTVVDGRFVDDD